MKNKKVKNAADHWYDGIHFRSDLEVKSYIMLKQAGFSPQYEPQTFHIWKGKKFSVPCYDVFKDRKLHRDVWGKNKYKPQDIKYTPDFIFYVPDSSGAEMMIVVESKGYPNDRYPYVKKMFRQYLEENHPNSMFFEVHNQKQMKAAIEIIKNI